MVDPWINPWTVLLPVKAAGYIGILYAIDISNTGTHRDTQRREKMAYTPKFRKMRNEILEMISDRHPLAQEMSASDFFKLLTSDYSNILSHAGYAPMGTGFFTD